MHTIIVPFINCVDHERILQLKLRQIRKALELRKHSGEVLKGDLVILLEAGSSHRLQQVVKRKKVLHKHLLHFLKHLQVLIFVNKVPLLLVILGRLLDDFTETTD